MDSVKTSVTIYTDGSCRGNPGPGGYGVVLLSGGHRREISGAVPSTTNNRMELQAAIRALDFLNAASRVTLITDSRYLRDGITRWIGNWRKNGWRTASRQPVKNAELWKRLLELAGRHDVRWRWTRSHAGVAENVRADELAVAGALRAAKGERGELSAAPVLEQVPRKGAMKAAGAARKKSSSERAVKGARPGKSAAVPDRRNVELKARAGDLEELRRRAMELGAEPTARLLQVDRFFRCAEGGRLKLRTEKRLDTGGRSGTGELVFYRRPDESGARLSEYALVPVKRGAQLSAILEAALGGLGEVRKERELLLLGRARIHLDRVEGLGDFLELEVVLEEGADEADARAEALMLLEKLGLGKDDLVPGAYRDLLET